MRAKHLNPKQSHEAGVVVVAAVARARVVAGAGGVGRRVPSEEKKKGCA